MAWAEPWSRPGPGLRPGPKPEPEQRPTTELKFKPGPIPALIDLGLGPNLGYEPKLQPGPESRPTGPCVLPDLELDINQIKTNVGSVSGQELDRALCLEPGLDRRQRPKLHLKQGLKPDLHEEQKPKYDPKLGQKLDPIEGLRRPELGQNPSQKFDPKLSLMLGVKPRLHEKAEQRVDPKPGRKSRTLSNTKLQTSSKTCFTSNSQNQPFVFLFLLFLLASFVDRSLAGPPRPTRPPLLSGQPFIIFWGIKDSSCANRPDLRSFGMEPEGRVAVFYEDSLGNYPYLVDKDTAVNGGLPQHTKLEPHLQKTAQDVEAALPAPRYLGLGVVRWSEWAPQWNRSGDKQGLYLEATRKLLRSFFPDWTPQEIERWSKVDFEAAAQSVMTETLREVKRLRPKALWGFSPFPSCSNGTPAQTSLSNYSRQCPAAEGALNDQLQWLWKRSSAVYPRLSLEKIQGGTPGAALYLSNQIREALRVSSLGGTADDLPVFPLVKTVYASTNTFLSQTDLVSTIGESAALGTAGVVVWEKTETKTERECQDLGDFVRTVLGPYCANVTAASRLCSASLCQGKGRCVRQDPDSPAFLHLPPLTDATTQKPDGAKPTDQPDSDPGPGEPDPAELWKQDFQCQWFTTPDRDVSDQQSPKDGAPAAGSGEDDVVRGTAVVPTVSGLETNSKGASETLNGDNGSGFSPKTTLEMPTDRGVGPKSGPKSIVLVLLLLVLCL